jgi:hypothetical protein
MNPARRHAYLQALGIQAWTLRSAPRAAPAPALQPGPEMTGAGSGPELREPPAATHGIVIGPGSGDTLLLCGRSADAATPLAADIVRSLAGEPVWSWLADAAAPGIPLQQAISERLFTRVVVFGPGLLPPAMAGDATVIGSARLVQVDSIAALSGSGAARRNLWLALSEQ